MKLQKDGIEIYVNTFPVKVHSFVCDAPARAYVKGIKYHSGYYACEKCVQSGDYTNKVILPENAVLRTDRSFDNMLHKDHHTESCPLKPLKVGCVTQFGLNYMHHVCLGVMRRLLLYWKGPRGKNLGK